MAAKKSTKTRRFWPIIAQASLVGPVLIMILAALNMSVDVSLGFALVMLGLATAVVIAFRSIRTYVCPVCETVVRPPRGWWRRAPGKKVMLDCPGCGLKWDASYSATPD